jgi:hypothetical protein
MGLFESVFNSIFNKNENINETQLEKELNQNGVQYISKKIAKEINDKIDTKSLAIQFILEELDAASQGNQYAQNFVETCGVKPFEYEGAMTKTTWQGEESKLEHLQLSFRQFLMQINNFDLRVQVSTSTVDKIMKIWEFGKYSKDSLNIQNDKTSILEYLIKNEIYISKKTFTQMFILVDEIRYLNDDVAYNGNIASLADSFKLTKIAVSKADEIRNILLTNNFEVGADEIVTAFYIINLSQITIKNDLEFNFEEIKNVLLTIHISSTGDFSKNISDIRTENIDKTIIVAKWIKFHKLN